MGEAEGEGGGGLAEKGDRALLGFVVLDGQVDGARAPVDGDKEVALAPLAIGGPELRQVLDVDVHEAEVVVPELALAPLRPLRGRWGPTAQPLGPEDAPDAVAVEVGQEVGDHEGQVVEGEVGGPAQRADYRTLLFRGLPGQLVRPGRMVEAVLWAALAPLADGLGADAEAAGQDAGGLLRASDLGAGDGSGSGVRVDLQHASPLSRCGGGQALEAVAILHNRQPNRIPTMLRDQTAEALRDIVRAYALETLADPDAVLVVDETGFLKQGKASCGVGRQYTGSAGKITNCRIGVFGAYASRHGHALIDRALYLPKAWTDDPARLAAAHVPPEVGFATKPRLAARMVERAIAAGVPFRWVAGDSVYGVGEVETALRRAGKGYVLGVNATQPFNSWIGKPEIAGTAERIAQGLAPSAWRRLSAGEGTKGPRLSDWAYLELADLDADEYRAGATGVWTRGLLIRRNIADGECACFTTLCPPGVPRVCQATCKTHPAATMRNPATPG
jgi:SRSO17 transposase